MTETNKIIIVVGIVFSFVVNSIMFGWEATRRNADEIVKINAKVMVDRVEVQRKAKECVDAGGLPKYNGELFWNCDRNK